MVLWRRSKIANILIVLQKAFYWSLGLVLIILLAIILAIQTPFLQNFVLTKFLESFKEKTGKEIQISEIKISWLDAVTLNGIVILDYNDEVMISSEKVRIDYNLIRLLQYGNISIDEIQLIGGVMNLVNYSDTLDINLVEWLSTMKTDSTKEKATNSKKPALLVKQISLQDFQFAYINQLNDSIDLPQFDFGHFRVVMENTTINKFKMHGDTIDLEIANMKLSDQRSNLKVDEMKSKVRLSNQGLELTELSLITPHSVIQDHISFYYSGFGDLGSFMDSVEVSIDLVKSRISNEDLRLFAALDFDLPTLELSAKISGKIPDLAIKNLNVAMGQTSLLGGAYLKGLPNIKETFMDINIKDGLVHITDIKPFVGELSENIKQLGNIKISGRFSGFVNDFVTKAEFRTDQGYLKSDLNLKIPEKWQNAKYSGALVLRNFNAGKFLKNHDLVQVINFDGKINGVGLTAKQADFFIEATLTNSGIYGHEYDKIVAKGRFAAEYFSGQFNITDPNLTLKSIGHIDLKKSPEEVSVFAQIDNIDFMALGLSSNEMSLKANLNLKMHGLNIDSVISVLKLKNVVFNYGDKKLKLDSIVLKTDNEYGKRLVTLGLPNINASISGDFLYSQFINDIGKLGSDLTEYFMSESEQPKIVNQQYSFGKYKIDFRLDYFDLAPYIAMLPHQIFVSKGGTVEGTYYQRENATLSFFMDLDSVNYEGIGFKENTLEVNLSKNLDSLDVTGIFYISSAIQDWRKIPTTEKMEVEAVWVNNRIDIETKIRQPQSKSKLDLQMAFLLEPNVVACEIKPSVLTILGEQWSFNPENRIEFSDNVLSVFNLSVENEYQYVAISGIYSDTLFSDLRVEVKELDLTSLSLVIPSEIQGTLDGDFEILRLEDQESSQINSQIHILNLTVDGYYVGNLAGRSDWFPEKQGIYLDFQIERKAINTIRLSGYFYPNDLNNQLALSADFDEANLRIAAPFFTGLFSNLKGMASGSVNISGTLDSPKLLGSAKIKQGAFTFDYLGVDYTFDGELTLDNQSIGLRDFAIQDKDRNSGNLTGYIYHEGFKNLRTDIKFAFNKMMLLNTNAKTGELYYGTAFATGSIQILGPLEDLAINAKVKSNAGTKIYIPLESTSEVEQKEYISFVDLSDTTQAFNIQEEVSKSVSGISLNFDMEITSDAYIELIFDLRAGDIIRGRANGNINLILNTDGQFELFGDVSITEGAYNFTIPNFALNKEFNVQPGSTISWYGDPYTGILNLSAIYKQMATLSDYDPEQVSVSQRLPYLVILDLKGEMLSPQIGFKIKLDDSQISASTEEKSVLDAININEQELKRQVFGLLILRKFLQQNKYEVSGGISGSISEFLSNQFSYFISQVDENLEIDVDMATMDQDAFNTFQLRLSYTFLDGRLKVTGGGGLPQGTAADAESSNSFVGDWTVRYMLTKDGHFRIKAFSTTDNSTGALQRETGISFQYIKSFDDLKELLSNSRDEGLKSNNIN